MLAYRDTYGKFVTVEQLLDVEGIERGLLEQLRPYVYVEESE
ncbi:MAG: helix-hairpin-helix domain-containing protein [Acutalibacteraceae bacterium]